MTMENKPKNIAIVGRPNVSLAMAALAANSHCLGSTCSVSDEPEVLTIKKTDVIEYKMMDTAETVANKLWSKRRPSRSRYKPHMGKKERARIHSQNIEVAGCEPVTHAQHNRANSHSAH